MIQLEVALTTLVAQVGGMGLLLQFPVTGHHLWSKFILVILLSWQYVVICCNSFFQPWLIQDGAMQLLAQPFRPLRIETGQ